jgi:hypothetical protein
MRLCVQRNDFGCRAEPFINHLPSLTLQKYYILDRIFQYAKLSAIQSMVRSCKARIHKSRKAGPGRTSRPGQTCERSDLIVPKATQLLAMLTGHKPYLLLGQMLSTVLDLQLHSKLRKTSWSECLGALAPFCVWQTFGFR